MEEERKYSLDYDDCDDGDEVKAVILIHDRLISHYLNSTDGLIPFDSIPHSKYQVHSDDMNHII